jgi:hypothetical protein
MCRLFRAQLEEEQQLLIDSDKAKVMGSPPKRTPPRATPPRPVAAASVTTLPDLSGEAGGGGTLLLPNAKAAKAAPAPGKAHARPAAGPESPGDTLIDVTDGGAAPRAPVAAGEGPGGTLMLNAGQAALARKAVAQATDPVPDDTEEVTTPEAPGGTQILGAGAAASAMRPAKAPRAQASTNIMTVEESEKAQRAAQAKLEQAAKGLVRTRTRADKRAELRQARSSRGMWIALGVGTLAAVAMIVGLLFLFFADESGVSARRARRGEIPATRATPLADPPDRPGTTRR